MSGGKKKGAANKIKKRKRREEIDVPLKAPYLYWYEILRRYHVNKYRAISEKRNELVPERKLHRYHVNIPYQRGRRMPFFFNRTQPQDYMKASERSKTSVPGDNFSAKICNCINDHYVVGELYSGNSI